MPIYIFFALFFFSSCSRLDLAVNLANTYIVNKADSFFDLSADQYKWLKKTLSNDIQKVKKVIFPQLASEMFKIAQTLEGQKNYDSFTVLHSYNRLEGLFFDGLRLFASSAVAFADKLSPNQMEYFQKQADKKFTEMKVNPQKKSYNRIKKNFDSWIGGINSHQKKEIRDFVFTNPPSINESVENRKNLIHDFLKSFSDKVARKEYVEKLFTSYESMQDTGYKKIVLEKHKKIAAFVTSILNKIGEEQKQTLIDNIRDRANQLIKISKG